jgi:parvulin-like peptidyl-prolyl isomerase
VGQVAGPVETSSGWVLVQVLGHEVRALDQVQLQRAAQARLEDWLTTARAEASIEIFDYWTDRVPEVPTLPS